MRRVNLLVFALVSSTFSCAPPPAPKPAEPPRDTPQQMVAAAEDLDRRFLEAFNSRDAAAMTALYWDSADVVSFPPDVMKWQGIDAIKEGTTAMFANMPPGTLEITESHHVPVGDAVASWGMWRGSFTAPDGTSMTQEGRFTDVKAKRNGKWVYLMDHASAPMPPPPPPPEPGATTPPTP